MDEFGGFGAVRGVEVDVLTDAYRISGVVQTRFNRVTDILNQQPGTFLVVNHATVSEHAAAAATVGSPSAMVAISSILVMSAPGVSGDSAGEMRIPKRPVRVQLAIPPFRVTGAYHVPQGSRPIDGLLNAADRFVAMTDVTISSGAHPELERAADAVAVCRDRAQVMLVTDDEAPDQLLADVLDERTAEAWLRADEGAR